MVIQPSFQGISVHDFWKPYEQYDCSHAYCNAHLIRELTFDHENLKQKWAGKMIRLMFKIKEEVDTSEKEFLEKMPFPDLCEKKYNQESL
jgi:transposase